VDTLREMEGTWKMSEAMVSYDEFREILLGFVEEGRELLDEAEPLLIRLEQSSRGDAPADSELLDTIFRSFHSLKGGAGMLDLQILRSITHEAETLLDQFRKGSFPLAHHHIDLMNRSCDLLRSLFEHLDEHTEDGSFEERSQVLILEIRNAISGLSGGDSWSAEQSGAAEHPGTREQAAREAPPEKESRPRPVITDEMAAQYKVEAEDLLHAAEESLLALEKEPDRMELIDKAFRAFHSFKGNSGFLGFSDLERLSHRTELILHEIRDGEVPISSGFVTLVLANFDILRVALSKLDEQEAPSIDDLESHLRMLESAVSSGAQGRGTAPETAKQDEGGESGTSEKPGDSVAPDAAREARQPGPEGGGDRALRKTVRVDVEKLDLLLDLVGELVISEVMVVQNPDIREHCSSLDRFEKSVRQLEKITRDLQDVATSIRMIPLANTFRRMPRLVRDLSVRGGKQVELKIFGEQTEVDKTLIEKITDPLVHIIRNSLDHGIEPPEERAAAGKSVTGRLVLEARHFGNEVWILVKDDGRGMNRRAILSKAAEQGMLEGDGSELSDEEVWKLIFAPGFTTVTQVTDVSGRGVGMDVVRRNIESISGRVDISSAPGEGTTVIVRIPLTLAILDGMVFRVGNNRYVLSTVDIRESLKPESGQVSRTMERREIVRIRDRLHPVLRLHEAFGVAPDHRELDEGIIIVLEHEEQVLCLFVDEILGQQQIVIKGLSEYLGKLNGVSGCTILGDGEVSLLLDTAGLFHLAGGQDRLAAPRRVASAAALDRAVLPMDDGETRQ